MAIFTNFANYLKCRNYFENVLGFELIDPTEYPEDYNLYGLLCSERNLRIAQNIWMLYGGALAWNNYPENPMPDEEVFGENNPPQELQEGFTLRDILDFKTTDKCGFLIDAQSLNLPITNRYFIGMKRLVPIETDGDDSIPLADRKRDIKIKYKNVIQFIKDNNQIPPDEQSLNENSPNELKITTTYDYGDFGFIDSHNKEYDVRQIGLLNHLHCSQSNYDYISSHSILFNDDYNNLSDLFNISTSSSEIPLNFRADEFFPENNNIENDITNQADWTKIDTSGFFGVLQFYLNSRANIRITYQTDVYNFILRFENKEKCKCDCLTCLCN